LDSSIDPAFGNRERMEWRLLTLADHHNCLLELRKGLEEKLRGKRCTRIDLKCLPVDVSVCSRDCIFSELDHYTLRILESEPLLIGPSDEIVFHSLNTSRGNNGFVVLFERRRGNEEFKVLMDCFSVEGITNQFTSIDDYFPTRTSFRVSICGDLTMQELARIHIAIYIIHNN
jgi:hypothetical protein